MREGCAEMTEDRVEMGIQNLKVWQRAISLAACICKQVLPQLPADERWSLSMQLRRAVQSVPANIAEGYGRYYYQESIRFCYIARGSLEETYSHLVLAHQLEYIDDAVFNPISEEITEIRRMLNGYIAHLKRTKRGENEPGSTHRLGEPLPYYESLSSVDLDPQSPDADPDKLDPDDLTT